MIPTEIYLAVEELFGTYGVGHLYALEQECASLPEALAEFMHDEYPEHLAPNHYRMEPICVQA